MPEVNAIDMQTEIQWYMRPYLLDFLIEAHGAFQLLPDTLFLAINLLDRYCSRRVVYKRHYQLVGCAALLIAAKYGDKKDRVPTVRELRSMCCALYDEEMFIQMEWHVLQTIGWQIGHPSVDSFLQLAFEEGGEDVEAEHMTWYLCELALFHREFVAVLPSVLARSALALSRCILGRPQPPQSDWASRYDATVILNLANYLSAPSQVLRRKYAYGDRHCVAQTVEYFLQTQQQQQQKAALESQPSVAQQPAQSAFGPQTPQKNHYSGAIMQHGCLTPPITPENEHLMKDQPWISDGQPRPPPTPTPVPTPPTFNPQYPQTAVQIQ